MPVHQNHDLAILALDIGAESGRAILGHFDGKSIKLKETHRFSNNPVRVGNHLFTDVLHIWDQIQCGIKKGFHLSNSKLASVGVDTWGVDYSLLDKYGNLIQNPYHYRDHRTKTSFDDLFSIVSREDVYYQTGNQLIDFNTLFQLFATRQQEPNLLDNAKTLLMLPDLFNYWLCGEKTSEFCISTTSQCLDQSSNKWAFDLLNKLQIPPNLFQNISFPGTVLGNIHDWILPTSVHGSIPVILPSGHDTGCAVTSVPVETDNFMFISSGTWSLVGTELEKPFITKASLALNFTNEGNPCGRTRFLKIVPGMWLLQQCKKEWLEAGDDYSYEQLVGLAAQTPECGPIIDISSPEFLDPGEMTARIQSFCQKTGQSIPQTKGEVVRCILESLAYSYRSLLEGFETILAKKFDVIHIIGGGSRNILLNQLTANITQRDVITGPVEATATGNLLIQAMGLGYIDTLDDIRNVVRRSFPLQHFSPFKTEIWEDGYHRYKRLLEHGLSN